MPNVNDNGGGKDEDEEEEEVRTLVVRAMDGDWVMGDDVVLPVTGDETVVDIQQARECGQWCIIVYVVVCYAVIEGKSNRDITL